MTGQDTRCVSDIIVIDTNCLKANDDCNHRQHHVRSHQMLFVCALVQITALNWKQQLSVTIATIQVETATPSSPNTSVNSIDCNCGDSNMTDSLSSAVQTIAPFINTDTVLRHAAAKGQLDEEQSVARGHSKMSKSSCKMTSELLSSMLLIRWQVRLSVCSWSSGVFSILTIATCRYRLRAVGFLFSPSSRRRHHQHRRPSPSRWRQDGQLAVV